jgi:2-dehydro-3-deoxyphosphogluconate aldolase/(4S)-4-hydroxy-2-oxoglutarate aldolase
MSRESILNEISKRKAVAVLAIKDLETLTKTVDAILEGGISVMEITLRVPNAIQLIADFSKQYKKDIVIGVGTVLNPADAELAIKAGARFVVSPIVKKEIIEKAHEFDVPVMPGCFTPTEILTAYEWGADVVKVFPADVLGMPFFKGILAPMPFLKIMPTGGVTLTNAGDWLKAGACAVGLGSALVDINAIKANNFGKLTENAKTIMHSIRSVNI